MAENEGIHLPARTTRGKRMSKLLNEEQEADDEFWNQEALQEGAVDDEYEEEGGGEDEFDSDFDEEESEEENGEAEAVERPKKKRLSAPGAKPSKKKAMLNKSAPRSSNSIVQAAEEAAGGEKPPSPTRSSKAAKRKRLSEAEQLGEVGDGEEGGGDGEEEGQWEQRRKSSRTAVVVKAIEREANRAAQQPRLVRAKKGPQEERKWSQEEMLLEAAQTEIQNGVLLEAMLAREEEVKRRAVIQKEVFEGPQILFHSKEGRQTLEFTKVKELPAAINSKAPPYPRRAVCPITGLPARYRDPFTGTPYATVAAFKAIRERSKKVKVS